MNKHAPMKRWAEVLSIVSGKNQKDVADESGVYPIYGSGGIIGRANGYLCEPGTTIVGRKGTINNPIYVNERFWNLFIQNICTTFADTSTFLPSINLQPFRVWQSGIYWL